MPTFTYQNLSQLIPTKILENILFLDQWNPPEGFREMSTAKRKEYQMRMMDNLASPTDNNFWIWFGPYVSGFPKYYNKSLPRLIYKEVVGDIDDSMRLIPLMRPFREDINPFKFRISGFNDHETLINIYLNSHNQELADQMKELGKVPIVTQEAILNNELDRASQLLDEFYIPDILDDRETLYQLLVDKGIPKTEAEEALNARLCDNP